MEPQLEEPHNITVEIENKECKGLKMLESSGVEKYALMDIRRAAEGPTRHLIKFPQEKTRKLPIQLFSEARVDKSGKVTSAWFNTDGCTICNTILGNGSFLISAKHVEGYSIIYNFVAPSFSSYKNIISTLESQDLKVKILGVEKFKPKSKTLTEKQERVLWLALKMGFFAFPRKITMKDLSERAGVGLSTLSEIVRRGTRRLVEDHFEL